MQGLRVFLTGIHCTSLNLHAVVEEEPQTVTTEPTAANKGVRLPVVVARCQEIDRSNQGKATAKAAVKTGPNQQYVFANPAWCGNKKTVTRGERANRLLRLRS
jgi:hypothetical protein